MLIGNIEIDPGLILAPLAGITNLPFRVACRRGGAGMVWSEMISAKALGFRNRRTEEMGRFHPEEHPVAAQIFGRDPDEMANAARFLENMGADVVDINMGCPVKKVLKTGSGAALMREPRLAALIVRKVVQEVRIPVTVKMRLGWSVQEENYLDLGRALRDQGAAALTLHPRTRIQGFSGPTRWEAVARLVRKVDIPVIGSGDILSGEDALRRFSETGCGALMIGRAALGKPWIFYEIHAYITGSPCNLDERFRTKLMQDHIEMLCLHLPERLSVGHLRKHLAWYSKGMAGGSSFRREINTLSDPDKIVRRAEEFFELKERLSDRTTV